MGGWRVHFVCFVLGHSRPPVCAVLGVPWLFSSKRISHFRQNHSVTIYDLENYFINTLRLSRNCVKYKVKPYTVHMLRLYFTLYCLHNGKAPCASAPGNKR